MKAAALLLALAAGWPVAAMAQQADKSGTVTQILCENGQAVEYGQPLFTIE